MWRIIIPVLMVGALLAPAVWLYTIDHWKSLLLTAALITLWLAKAVMEHK